MNINESIYFSSNYKIADLDLENRDQIIKAFEDRVITFYLEPLDILNDNKNAFAAGIIIFSLIDAFSRYSTNENSVKIRMKKWFKNNISFKPDNDNTENQKQEISEIIYKDFRCGLVHESHIKNGGQFSYDIESTLLFDDNIVINPYHITNDIKKYFCHFLSTLSCDDNQYDIFKERIKKDFKEEIN